MDKSDLDKLNQALQVVQVATSKALLTLQDHQVVLEAIKTLQDNIESQKGVKYERKT